MRAGSPASRSSRSATFHRASLDADEDECVPAARRIQAPRSHRPRSPQEARRPGHVGDSAPGLPRVGGTTPRAEAQRRDVGLDQRDGGCGVKITRSRRRRPAACRPATAAGARSKGGREPALLLMNKRSGRGLGPAPGPRLGSFARRRGRSLPFYPEAVPMQGVAITQKPYPLARRRPRAEACAGTAPRAPAHPGRPL